MIYSSQPTYPDAPYPSIIQVMEGRTYAAPARQALKRRPRDDSSKDGLIRSVLTEQSMTTQQVQRALIAAEIDLDLDVNQLRVRLRGMAQRGIGVRAVPVFGGPTEWAAM